jgi:hypothetical protein
MRQERIISYQESLESRVKYLEELVSAMKIWLDHHAEDLECLHEFRVEHL